MTHRSPTGLATLLALLAPLSALARSDSPAAPAAPRCGAEQLHAAKLLQTAETLSGVDLADVAVHRNSRLPAVMGAAAYATGDDVYLAPGRTAALGHLLWHVVQQRTGRVRPTRVLRGSLVNDDRALEAEAEAMSVVLEYGAFFAGDDRCIEDRPARSAEGWVVQR